MKYFVNLSNNNNIICSQCLIKKTNVCLSINLNNKTLPFYYTLYKQNKIHNIPKGRAIIKKKLHYTHRQENIFQV